MMDVGRRMAVIGGGAAAMLAAAPAARGAGLLGRSIATDGKTLRAVRVAPGADGRTRIEDVTLATDVSPYPLFTQFLTHPATTVAIYQAPPHHRIAAAKSVRSLLFIIDGEIAIQTYPGHRTCGLGSIILFEDGAACAERAGPRGYTAIKVILAA